MQDPGRLALFDEYLEMSKLFQIFANTLSILNDFLSSSTFVAIAEKVGELEIGSILMYMMMVKRNRCTSFLCPFQFCSMDL